MFGFLPVSICHVCPRVRPALASSLLADTPMVFRACLNRPARDLLAMSTRVFANTSVVNTGRAKLVDRGTQGMHYVCVSTLKERLERIVGSGRVASPRAWSIAAFGKSNASQVQKLLDRQTAEEGRVHLATLNALADVAGVSRVWLAYGISMEPPGSQTDDQLDIPVGSFQMKLRSRPELQREIDSHPERWTLSTVARALGLELEHDASGRPPGGWVQILDDIQAGRYDRTSSGIVGEAAARQVGRRPKLPPKLKK